jgi:hypothetical protein
MVNKYPGKCLYCGGHVAKNAGNCFKQGAKFVVAHLACNDAKSPRVTTFYSPVSGWSGTQNSRGRCEDAPCCGCCTC